MKNEQLSIIILVITPFIYLFPHTFQFIEMGNDFELLYFSYKKYIFEFIQIGHIPLWSPSESSGYSLIFNPFAQFFYPLSWVLYFFSFLIGDFTKHIYLLYTILGISIYNVGQYLWLRKLNIDIKYCLIATLITCLGLKINEIIRFPNAIHSFAWFSWILYGMTLSLEDNKKIKSFLLLFISTLLILTAGYPYYILYGLFLFSIYFIFISIPKVRYAIFEKKKFQNYLNFFIINATAPILAVILVLPWFIGIQEIMEITHDRNLQDIKFSFTLSSNFIDQLGSWIFPPISMAEGYYYFGSITTLLFILYIINFLFNKKKDNKEKYFIILFFIFFILNYQFAAAENSFLFKLIWNNIDLIQNFRGFSRMNILLLPLFSVLFCFAIQSIINKKYNINFMKINLVVVITILSLQIYFIEFSNIQNIYWENWQQKRLLSASNSFTSFSIIFQLYNNYLYSIFFIISFFMIALLKRNFLVNFAPLFIIAIVILELFVLVNIQWAIPYKYYDANNYNLTSKKPLKDLRNSFLNERIVTEVKGNTYFRNLRKFNINYVDQLGIENHSKLINKYFKRNGEFRDHISLEEIKKVSLFWALKSNKDKVFFTRNINHLNIEDFVDDIITSKKEKDSSIKIDIKNYNGNEILIDLEAKVEGYITFVDNWSPGWNVLVNHKEKKMLKALNTYKSVKVNFGSNKIKFRYSPW